jgi:hypothetical protein
MNQVMPEQPQLIFIVGCPHSGTSILHRLFSLHKDTLGIPGESGLFLNNPSNERIQSTLSNWRAQAMDEAKQYIVEKTPWHGLKIDQISGMVPGARFIFIIRNPIDTYGSLKQRGATNRIKDSCMGRIEIISQFFKAAIQANAPLITLEELTNNPTEKLLQCLNAVHIVSTKPDVEAILASQAATVGPKGTRIRENEPSDRTDGASHRELRAWQVSQPIFNNTRNRHDVEPAEAEQITAELHPLVSQLSHQLQLTAWGEDFPFLLSQPDS